MAGNKDTRELIVKVASRLFISKGFDKTSMRNICDDLGMSKGAVYHYFKSKEEIVDAVFAMQDEFIHKQNITLQRDMKGMNAKEQISELLKKSIENQPVYESDDDISSVLKSPEYILKYMRDNVYKNAPVISKLIIDGKEDHSLDVKYPLECAEAFLLLLNIWCDPTIFDCDKEKFDRKVKFIQLMMRALGIDVIDDELTNCLLTLFENFISKSV